MSLWPVSIVLDGDEMPLDEVRADVQIHHGRTEVFAEPSASTCQVAFLEVDHAFTQAFRVGVSLEVMVANGGAPLPRFTGRVTDAVLDVDTLTVIATGKLSELGQYRVGAVAWPAEAWIARVNRVFAEAGISSLLVLDAPAAVFNPVLAARDPYAAGGPLTLSDYLNSLAAMVGAAVTDLPDGRIFVQPIGERDALETDVPGHHGNIDPAAVAYAPVWSQLLPAGNIVTVSYTPGATLPARTGTLTDNSPVVTGLPSTLDIIVGMDVSGLGIPQDTRVQSVQSGTQITLSRSANISAQKNGSISAPGSTTIGDISDTSDLSVGMTVASGDLQGGTVVTGIESHDSISISKPSIGSGAQTLTFTAPAACVLTFQVETAYVTHQDDPSVALYGERPVQIDTTFLYVADADRRATERLARAALPRWNLPAAPIIEGLELKIGNPVTLNHMPAASPSTDWRAFLEGWSEQITGDDWTMELALSDPAASGVTYALTWALVPAEWAWNELEPDATWEDAQTLEEITP